jgi:hypothetical protein
MRNRAGIAFSSLLVTILFIWASGAYGSEHDTGSPQGLAPKSTRPGSPVIKQQFVSTPSKKSGELLVVEAKVEEMSKKVIKEMPVVANEHASTLMAMRKKGTKFLINALTSMLQEGEAWNEEMEAEIFGLTPDETDDAGRTNFDLLSDEEKHEVSLAYTKKRKDLRAKLIEEVQKQLQAMNDPHATALAMIVGKTSAGNLMAYDLAVERIEQENLKDPICLSCGEQVSIDTGYGFHEAMGETATEAVKLLSSGYSDGRHVITSDGRAASFGINPDGTVEAKTIPTMTKAEALKMGEDPAVIMGLARLFRPQYDKQTKSWPKGWDAEQHVKPVEAFLKNVVPKTVKAMESAEKGTALAAVASTGPSESFRIPPRDVRSYMAEVKENGGAPLAHIYPRPEILAEDLNLKGVDGRPLMTLAQARRTEAQTEYVKDANGNSIPKGWHMRRDDFGQAFNVDFDWEAIAALPTARKAEVARVLNEIAAQPDPGPFKFVLGYYDGYCPWCNVRNYAPTIKNLATLNAHIANPRLPLKWVYSQEYNDWLTRGRSNSLTTLRN